MMTGRQNLCLSYLATMGVGCSPIHVAMCLFW